ncbi:MAG: hypothetical protein JST75_03480 [Bacteroidetes bacterium]|nr:hypothetical protein [Bacteroidota bacterium]
MKDKIKKDSSLSPEDMESLELLRKANESKGKQLRVDVNKGDLTEVNELKQITEKSFDNPEEKYNIYYKGLRNLLMKYLPKGKEYAEGRQIIYDEKNIFLNRGKKKSDNDGIRGSDGRMTYQEKMNEMLEVVTRWVSESQDPIDLYNMIYDLNEKHGYGHEVYDETSIKFQKQFQKEKGQ